MIVIAMATKKPTPKSIAARHGDAAFNTSNVSTILELAKRTRAGTEAEIDVNEDAIAADAAAQAYRKAKLATVTAAVAAAVTANEELGESAVRGSVLLTDISDAITDAMAEAAPAPPDADAKEQLAAYTEFTQACLSAIGAAFTP